MSVTSVTYAHVTRRSASYTPTSTPANALQGACWSAAIHYGMNFKVYSVRGFPARNGELKSKWYGARSENKHDIA